MSTPLNIGWAFGFNKDIRGSVHSLSTDDRNAIFFISSHSGVIYDFEHRTQLILQGHCNLISCCAVSADKRWIVTGDIGEENILVVWDSKTGAPVKTIFMPHEVGVTSVDISSDSLFVVTLGAADSEGKQSLAIWAWTADEDTAFLRQTIQSNEFQHTVKLDPKSQSSIATTGASSVCFWTWKEFSLEGYSARVSKSEFGHFSGDFTSTVFLPGTNNALTATSDGYIVHWETQSATLQVETKSRPVRAASKVLRLVESGIQVMCTTANNYLAVACVDGTVRFYDYFLRIEAWFEDLCAGPISSLSLGNQRLPYQEGEAGAPGLKFWVPDIIVGTSDAFIIGVDSRIFDEIRPEDRRGTLLMQGMVEEVTGLACHPTKTLIAMTCGNGSLQVWDYEMKLLMNLREFNSNEPIPIGTRPDKIPPPLRPSCVSFEPHGEFVAVGFLSGLVKFLHKTSYEDVASFLPTSEAITGLRFSQSGLYLAAIDRGNHVLLFKRDSFIEESTPENDPSTIFQYIGRIKSHSKSITGLEFGWRENVEILISVSEDRRCLEYDLVSSTVQAGIQCVVGEGASHRGRIIDQSATPTALMFHPHLNDDVEDRFIVSNDEYKFKEINVDSKQCRKTTLAPTFGGPIKWLLPVKKLDLTCNHYAYATSDRVIGLGLLPLTGNPSEVMGLVAHPGRISAVAISRDGNHFFSAGGSDLSVNMWNVDTKCLVSTKCEDDGGDISNFLSLLEGGENGDLHNDIIDYFYYGQIRAQGEDCMDRRNITGRIPLEEVPSLMRAIGYYPTEEDVHNMTNEVRYRTFMNTGETINDVQLNEFIRLYVNHRPVIPLNNASIQQAFQQIISSLHLEGNSISWGELKKVLLTEGEAINTADLDSYLSALIGGDARAIEDSVQFTPDLFAAEVLGFEGFPSN